jgi:hypothetical protein
MSYANMMYDQFLKDLSSLVGRGDAAGIDTASALADLLGRALGEMPGGAPESAREYLRECCESYIVDAAEEYLNDIEDCAAYILACAVDCASQQHSRTMSFSVVNDDKPVPFTTHWQHKNIAGVTFKKTDTAEAEAWITAALLAGYGPRAAPTVAAVSTPSKGGSHDRASG